LRDLRVAAVKRRIEAGDLGQLRQTVQQQSDRSEIVRLMQRCQRNELLECPQHTCVESHRAREFKAAMHDAMTYASQPVAGETLTQVNDEVVQCAGVAELGAFVPGVLRLEPAARILCCEVRCSVQSLDLAMLPQLEPIGA